jgi:excinuclease ABC subunit A
LKRPFQELSKTDQELLLYGPPRPEAARTGFHGIIPWLRDTLEETKSEGYREYMMQFMSATECPRCHGRRLRPESLAVTIPIADAAEHPPVNRDDRDVEPMTSSNSRRSVSIAEFTALSLERAMMGARSMQFVGRDRLIADRLQREIIERLEFLNAVGLGYLSLNRSAATLSGGEGQRIRLATQIGSRLRGVLYVLDEPSIGLHQRDNAKLLESLRGLRDMGNTVIVVEHDEEAIRTADHVIDIGPGAGIHGGHIIAEGTPEDIMACPDSLTAG